jgi:5-formyltetrahydrofolate cyclo-ligase
MPDNLAQKKEELRRQMLQLRRQAAPQLLAEDSARLCAHLVNQHVWKESGSVLLFCPLPGEPDVRPLLAEALAGGKRLALPRYAPSRGEYEACLVNDLGSLRVGHFGILEPAPDAPWVELLRLDFLGVPGLAYDRDGGRLGRGRGYFDRLLTQSGGHKCGVAFDWQVVPEVPVGARDIRVNSLLTPSGWSGCAGQRAGL